MVNFDEYSNVVSAIQQSIKTGGVNLLINNAGMMNKDTVRNVTRKSITDSFELNTMAPMLFTQVCIQK